MGAETSKLQEATEEVKQEIEQQAAVQEVRVVEKCCVEQACKQLPALLQAVGQADPMVLSCHPLSMQAWHVQPP